MTISKTKTSNKINQKPKTLINFFSFKSMSSASSSSSSPSSSLHTSTSSPFSSSSSESMMEESLKNAELVIQKWEINDDCYASFVSVFQETKREATIYINCVKGVHRAMRFLVSNDSKSERLFACQKLMQIAMKRLDKEFHRMLSDHREYLGHESVSIRSSFESEDEQQLNLSVSDDEQMSLIAVSNLKLIADTMISCGYGKECIEAYKIIRKSAIDEALFHLGIQRFSSSCINKIINSAHFGNHIKRWLNAVQIAVKKLFHRENFLCNQIFSSPTIRDSCFESSTKEAATNLFMFPQIIASKHKKLKPETVFALIDLHISISDLLPEIDSIFSAESVASVRLQALSSLHQLADSIRMILGEFESSIHKNSSKITVSGGGIHPLNNSVMIYLTSLANYASSLSGIVDSAKLQRIILVLLCKLDGKAKLHNSAALSYLFLINNLNFVIEKVSTTPLKFILGEEWIIDHENKLNQYTLSYESMTWNKVISCLPEKLAGSPEKVTECFRRLYFKFEEVYEMQAAWIVVDEKMRNKLKESIVKKLVPVYEEFYCKYSMMLSEDERCMEMLMTLSPENMVKYLSGMFMGTTMVLRSLSSTYSFLTLPAVSDSVSRVSRFLPVMQNIIIR